MRSCCFRSTQRGRWATWTTNWDRYKMHSTRGSGGCSEVFKVVMVSHIKNFCSFFQVSIHSVWLGNNITPLREEEWGEDEEDEADTPAPTSPPLSPINSRSVKLTHFLSRIQALKRVTKTVDLTLQEASRWCGHPLMFPVPPGALQPVAHPWLPEQQEDTNHPHQ